MKKLLAVVAGLMTCSAIYALPVYNPDQPELLKYGVFTCNDDNWGFEFGYRGDFVFDRQLQVRNNNGNLSDFHKDVTEFERSTNAGQVTLNLWDRVDVYGWLGSSQTAAEAQVSFLTAAEPTPMLNLRGLSQNGFAYGFGARAVLWQCGRTAVGVDAQYAHTRADLQSFTIDGVPVQSFTDPVTGAAIDPNNFALRSREYQVSLGVSHRICSLVPYVAVKYSNVRARITGPAVGVITDPTVKFQNRDWIGMAAGISFTDSERMHVTVEGRFIDEQALTVAADIRF